MFLSDGFRKRCLKSGLALLSALLIAIFTGSLALAARDSAAPTGSIMINGGAGFTNTRNVTLNLWAQDNSGQVPLMAISFDGQYWNPWQAYKTALAVTLPEGDGLKTVYVTFRDGSGNVSPVYSASITLDTLAPQIYDVNMNLIGPNQVKITWRTSEPAFCITQYQGDSTPIILNQQQQQIQTAQSVYYTLEHEVVLDQLWAGYTYTIQITARDMAGNQSQPVQQMITVPGGTARDTVPPTGSLNINSGARITNNYQVTLFLSATDNSSGAISVQFSNDGWSWSPWEVLTPSKLWYLSAGDGVKTVYVRFQDRAGNISPAYSATIVLDTKAPTIYDVKVETLGINTIRVSWRTDQVTYGYFEYYWMSPSMTRRIEQKVPSDTHAVEISAILSNTNYYYVIQAVDEAGNVTRYDNVFAWQERDTTPPQGQLIINEGRDYVNNRQIKVQVKASDDQSRTADIDFQLSNNGYSWSTWYSATSTINWNLDYGDGQKTIYYRFRDDAGNVSKTERYVVTLDTKAPQISNVSVDLVTGNTIRVRWRTDEPTVGLVEVGSYRAQSSYYNTDHSVNISGLSGSSYRYTINAEDRAGNKRVYQGQFNMPSKDTTPPSGSISLNNGAQYTNRTQVSVKIDVRDNQSGRLEYQLSNDGRAWSSWAQVATSVTWTLTGGDGTKTVYARFRDAAGNVSTAVTAQIILDTKAPRISSVAVAAVSSREVRISWRTDEPTSGTVLYGSGSRGSLDKRSDSGRSSSYTTEHTVTLSGLSEGTSYRFQIQSTDQAGNRATHDGNFATSSAADTTPPRGSIRINGGAASTNSSQVRIDIEASDDRGGRIEYQLSNDARVWSAWNNVVKSVNWTLAPGTGTRTVYARFRDAAGNISATVSDDIIVSSTSTPPSNSSEAPKISGISVEKIDDKSVRIRWKTDKPTIAVITYYVASNSGTKKEERFNSGSQDRSADYKTEHSVVLTNLIPNSTYKFKIMAIDQSGKSSVTPEQSFVLSTKSGSATLDTSRQYAANYAWPGLWLPDPRQNLNAIG